LFLATQQWRVGERAVEHSLGDDLVRLLRHVHAIPVGEAARVAPDLGRPGARRARVVRSTAAAARDQGIADPEPARVLDELHGGAVVVGVDELRAGVPRLEPADLAAQRLVVARGEVVEPPEAPVLVEVRGVAAAGEHAQVRRHAADGEVVRDQDRPRAQADELLDGGAYVRDDVRDELVRLLARLGGIAEPEPEVVVVAADLAQHDQRLVQKLPDLST
jgi:hypothetical protein